MEEKEFLDLEKLLEDRIKEKEFKNEISKLCSWLTDKLREKKLLSYKYGLNCAVVNKVDGSYCVDLCLDDYRTSYIRYCDFGIRRKKFLETLVGEELEYYMELTIAMNVRLEKRHVEKLLLLYKVYS